ncbi:IS605 family transposase OrfB [Methanolobus psychrophilus R15]|nr:IS605 family transposase OrfB [Methanolobus psychrophilus R15]
MSKQNKAYKFRLYPNPEQIEFFIKSFGCCRFIFNKMLGDKIEHYQVTKTMLNNTPAQYKEEYPWLKEVDSLALANEQLTLQQAFRNFFRDQKIGFPKFKSKKHSRRTYTTNNQKGTVAVVDNRHAKLPKIGIVRCRVHRQIPEDHKIKSATISQTGSGKFYISFLVEFEEEEVVVPLDKKNSIGLDYSSPNFYVDDQGREANYPRFYRKGQKKLAAEQQKLARMKLNSNNYRKQKRKVAKVHEMVANQRLDWIRKEALSLSKKYDYVFVENIHLRGLAGSLNLGKSTNDNGFGMFRTIMEQKMNEIGKKLVKIPRFYPSSMTCSVCNTVYRGLTLDDRTWTCTCGTFHDRDINAAVNIRNYGMTMIQQTAGTAGIAC